MLRPADTRALEINLAQLHPLGASIYTGQKPVAVNIGNPHLVFFVEDLEKVEIEILGPLLENDPLFPERVNVGFAQVLQPDTIRLRVWERGSGLTMACGTGACAAVVALYYGGIFPSTFPRLIKVHQQGGELRIEWLENDDILMTGPAHMSFKGTFIHAF